MRIHRRLLGAATAVCALSLVGTSVAATFNASVHASEKISVGRLDVRVGHENNNQSDNGTVHFTNLGPVDSTFASSNAATTLVNKGSVSTTHLVLGASDHIHGHDAAGSALADELCVRVRVVGATELYNGTLRALEATPVHVPMALAPDDSVRLQSDFYAGGPGAPAGCSGLTASAAGGTVTPTLTYTFEG